MQIGQQEHQVLAVVDRDVADVIRAASHRLATVVEWQSVPAIAPRVTANSVKIHLFIFQL